MWDIGVFLLKQRPQASLATPYSMQVWRESPRGPPTPRHHYGCADLLPSELERKV